MAKVKLNEASRNELLAITRKELDLRSKPSREANPAGPYSNRLERSAGYKGFGIKDVDTSTVLTNNSLVVKLNVGDYEDVVELEDILYWIQISAENTNSYTKNQINTKVVTQALMNSIDGMDIKLDCTCKDWQYRFAYQATLLGYKYGEKEGRPNEDARANPDNRGGVCFDGNTLVCTKNGYIPIKDIKIGDEVFTHKGRLKKVTDIMKRTTNNIVKLHIGTQDIICTDNHPFYTCNSHHTKFDFREAQNICRNNIYVCKPYFKLNNNENVNTTYAFLLGLYLADGNISERPYRDYALTNMELAFDDRQLDIYDKLLKQANIEYSIKTNNKNTHSGCIVIHNSELRDFCNKYGSHTYKDKVSKRLSNNVLSWSNEAKYALIKGFFAGDGQFGSNGKYLNVRLLNTNKQIIELLNIILHSLNIPTKCFEFERKPRYICNSQNISNAKNMFCITITGPNVELFADLKQFKGNKSSNYPNSSYRLFTKQYDDTLYTFSTIKSLEPVNNYNDYVYNISVEDDESYLVTYDNIAVHNCKHLTSVLSNKRWLQQVTSTFMNWLEKNIDGVNKYLGLKGSKVLTLPNELARQNAKLSWQIRRDKNAEEQEQEPEEQNIQDTTKNVQGNNPSTNNYNNIDDNSSNSVDNNE